ncbi:MAG: hypothetical protein OJF52_003719 [Nitrospira sp.]|nr:MAG: hypothetical protein OJF52_003719 [Nitrospira sp.]
MTRVLLILVILFSTSTIARANDFEDGLAAYERKDYATAFAKFMNAATVSSPPFDEWLARARPANPEVPDVALTSYWLKKYGSGPEADRTRAQFYLGVMYNIGQGVPQDSQQAVQWYTKAALAGLTDAQYTLGVVYENGDGVPQDYQQAVRWFTKAAEAGDAGAQYDLASMYYRGQGVPRDYVLAYMWVNLAASKKSEYVKKRDEIATFMTPTQHAEAQKLAREWKPTTGTQASAGEASHYSEAPDRRQYERVLTLFKDGDLDGARRGFTAFIASYPGSVLAPNAWFWLGESYYGRKDYQHAIEAYNRVELDYPLSEKVPAALLKKGYSYIAVRDPKGAAAVLKQVVTLFPNSMEAGKAVNMLAQLAEMLDRAPSKVEDAKKEAAPASTGTGFVVSKQGHIMTNYHVVEKCGTVRATTEGRKKEVTIVGTDAENDLALLQLSDPVPSMARFREGRTIRPGDGVIVVGFPLPGLLASEAQVTTGTVSALAGIGNNTRFLQISAPVQPGNSGGPLLDQSGNTVGVVVSKLNALTIAKTTGDIPQNINFAINSAVAKAFLDSQSVEYETGVSSQSVGAAEIGAAARKFTLLLECYR